jgi:cobalt-precorrin-5B (C1)-methyltransferase
MTPTPRSGYTLPVFACASAIASVCHLHQTRNLTTVTVNLIEPNQAVEIPVEQVAKLSETQALAITRSDPGDNLDLTRHTPVWAIVEQLENATEPITIRGGEGVGKIAAQGTSAIYDYAKRLMLANLQPLLAPDEKIKVTIILPEGQALAQRTSNEAFGVVEGLSLLGTTGISQPLSAPGQLAEFQSELAQKSQKFDTLVFCLGENGLDLAQKVGIIPERLVKTANWLGSLLVAASESGVKNILLFGYHGKLIKLAGGIFHTHHHLADGRLEILTAYGAKVGLPTPQLQQILACPTTEAALQQLRQWDQARGTRWVEEIYSAIAYAIDTRSQAYIRKHSSHPVTVGSILFDRDRQVIVQSPNGTALMSQVC